MHIQPHRAVRSAARCKSIVAPALAIVFLAASAAGAQGALVPTERYVKQAYADLLARQPDATELSTYAGALDNLTLTRTGFATAITGLVEFSDDKTTSFYTQLLKRISSPAERAPLVSVLQSGQSFEVVEATIAGSAEYFANRGAGTNNGFLDALYSDFLSRLITPSERTGFVNALTTGTTRTQVVSSILTSTEYRTGMVTRDYNTFLHRTPGTPEASGFVNSALDERQIVRALVASDEYFNLAQTVPEPAALSAVMLPLLACLRRRRRGAVTFLST